MKYLVLQTKKMAAQRPGEIVERNIITASTTANAVAFSKHKIKGIARVYFLFNSYNDPISLIQMSLQNSI